ncbi:MAG: 30S ribosomal protein S6 [Flavobacteriales bacterium]|nr:MAG: 30S ribosomal protein S6 [Flavobacteriales bacterium]
MNRYECVFIMTPVLSEEQTKETVKKFKEFLKKNKASIVHEKSWGLRKLAYPIQKKTTGFYHSVEFESEGALINAFETQFRRDERIIRFLTMKMDKHAIAFAESRRENGQKAAPQEAPKDEVKKEVPKKEDLPAKASAKEKKEEEIIGKDKTKADSSAEEKVEAEAQPAEQGS